MPLGGDVFDMSDDEPLPGAFFQQSRREAHSLLRLAGELDTELNRFTHPPFQQLRMLFRHMALVLRMNQSQQGIGIGACCLYPEKSLKSRTQVNELAGDGS